MSDTAARTSYAAFQQRGIKLDMSRGKPAPEQLALSEALLGPITDFRGADGTDTRNYGGVLGIPEARALFGSLLDLPAAQVVAEGNSSREAWDEYNEIWRTYREFVPSDEYQRLWYAESLKRLNALAGSRRDRLLSMKSGVPTVMWGVLIAGGAITIGFSFLFGMRNARAQAVMTASLALTIGVVLLSIVALQEPFSGITRVDPEPFHQVDRILELWREAGGGP